VLDDGTVVLVFANRELDDVRCDGPDLAPLGVDHAAGRLASESTVLRSRYAKGWS
jgi:hypothetical protein